MDEGYLPRAQKIYISQDKHSGQKISTWLSFADWLVSMSLNNNEVWREYFQVENVLFPAHNKEWRIGTLNSVCIFWVIKPNPIFSATVMLVLVLLRHGCQNHQYATLLSGCFSKFQTSVDF